MKSSKVSVSARTFLAPELLSIQLGPALVFLGALSGIELPHVLEQAQRPLWVLRPLNREHLRAAGSHFGAFDRVVVDEHEAVEAEVQPRGEGAEVLRLRQPVDHGCHDVIAAKSTDRGSRTRATRRALRSCCTGTRARRSASGARASGGARDGRRRTRRPRRPPRRRTPRHSVLSQSTTTTLRSGREPAVQVARNDRSTGHAGTRLDTGCARARRAAGRAPRLRSRHSARDSRSPRPLADQALHASDTARSASACRTRMLSADESAPWDGQMTRSVSDDRLRAMCAHSPLEIAGHVLQVRAHKLDVTCLFTRQFAQPVAHPQQHDVHAATRAR